MSTIYADTLGKALATRGNFKIFNDNGHLAVFHVAKELLWDENDNHFYGNRDEAVRVGYVSDIANAEIAFDAAEAELAALGAA